VPLAIWFLISALSLIGADRTEVVAFLAAPVNAVLMALFIIAALMHMALGLQMVIEDYATGEGSKVTFLILNRFFAWVVGAASIYALLKIALSRSLS
jgi:succinate dehydrogenase / fumarate reductase membrane anchor subunit